MRLSQLRWYLGIAIGLLILALTTISKKLPYFWDSDQNSALDINSPNNNGENAGIQRSKFYQFYTSGQLERAWSLAEKKLQAFTVNPSKAACVRSVQERIEKIEHLKEKIQTGLKAHAQKEIADLDLDDLAGLELPEIKLPERKRKLLPASHLYWLNQKPFTSSLETSGLSDTESQFLHDYYQVRSSEAALDIGREIVAFNQKSSNMICYAMVIPLISFEKLNSDGQYDSLINMFDNEQLLLLSDFCLLECERPDVSLAIARYRAQKEDTPISILNWAEDLIDRCSGFQRPCLAGKIALLVEHKLKDPEDIVRLKLREAHSHSLAGDSALAARYCQSIVTEFPKTRLYGLIQARYFTYLSKQGEADCLLNEIDSHLEDTRIKAYRANLLYLKWWALNKTNRSEQAGILAGEIVGLYPDNKLVAPIILSQAMEALSEQKYDQCQQLLVKLTNDFAGTQAAQKAWNLLSSMKGQI